MRKVEKIEDVVIRYDRFISEYSKQLELTEYIYSIRVKKFLNQLEFLIDKKNKLIDHNMIRRYKYFIIGNFFNYDSRRLVRNSPSRRLVRNSPSKRLLEDNKKVDDLFVTHRVDDLFVTHRVKDY